jgi:hypothetical protein
MRTYIISAFAAAIINLLLTGAYSGGNPEKEKLISRRWQFFGMEIGTASALSATQLETMRKTNYFQFNKNGTYQLVLLSETINGKWKLMENQTRLLLDGGTDKAAIFSLTELTNDRLVLTQTDKATGQSIRLLFVSTMQ